MSFTKSYTIGDRRQTALSDLQNNASIQAEKSRKRTSLTSYFTGNTLLSNSVAITICDGRKDSSTASLSSKSKNAALCGGISKSAPCKHCV